MAKPDTNNPKITFDTPVGQAVLFKALEQSPAAVSLVDLDGNFVYVNQRFTDVTGYSFEEVVGQHTRILKSGQLSRARYQALWETLLGGEEWIGEFHNRRKDGEFYWEQATISPIRNERGEIEYFVKLSVDFTREHDLEESLRVQHRLYTQITENMSDVVAILDSDACYRYVTPSSEHVLGYTPEELKGHSVFKFIAEDQREPHERSFDNALNGRSGQIETRFRHKNGQYIWLESAARALPDESSGRVGLLIASRDITQRKLAEESRFRTNARLKRRKELLQNSLRQMQELTEELHEAQARYERLVRATNGFVFSVALENGMVVDAVNYPGCEQVTGYTAKEYAEDTELWRRMIHPDDASQVLNQVKELTDGASTVVIEHRIIHRDGSERWLKNTSVARHDEAGRLIGYDGLITDITEFKNAEAERVALTNQLRNMALRDALTGLMNRRGFEEELNRLWNLSLRHPFPMGLLVIDIDHFKTLNDTYGHMAGDRILIECATLIQESVRDSDVVCRFGGDEMTVILPWSEEDETLMIAERMLESFRSRVFCKGAHDLHMSISIGTATVTPSRDQTPERFLARADKAVYRAKQLGRNRVCRAEDPLPTTGAVTGESPSSVAGSSSALGRILVVDDDLAIRKLLDRLLSRGGYEVQCVESAAAALDVLEADRGRIDAALVDLNLGMDSGLDLMQQMKAIDDAAICIVITGQVTVESAVESLRSGAYDYVQKPFSAAQVMAALKRAITYRRLLIENRRYQTHLENMVREKSAAHTRALERLQLSFQFTLESLAAMLDARERKTGEHSKRVARMSHILARELDVAPEDVEVIETGALLHDIGKIAIPDAVLLKPGPLNEEERAIIRRHPQIGYDMIRNNPDLKDASEIVLSHQEFYDGNGYPRGLKGEDICLGARIFAVADAYDAMRAERPYSKSVGAEDALQEILNHKGTQFDPDVVDALVRCQDEIEQVGNWMSLHSVEDSP